VRRFARRSLLTFWPALLVVGCLVAAGAWSVAAQQGEDQQPVPAETGPTASGEQVSPAELPTPEACPSAAPREVPRLAPGEAGAQDIDELKRRANEEAERTATPAPPNLEEDSQ